MSEFLQKTVSERLERMHNYGPADRFADGYTTAMKEVLLLLIAADGKNFTNRRVYEEDAYAKERPWEPTHMLIEAAASEIESVSDDHRAQHADGHYVSCSCGFPVSCMEEFDMHWDREMAKAALLAARRAVGK